MAWDTHHSIYRNTAQFQIIVNLAPIKCSRITGTVFAAIVTPLPIQFVYESALSLTLGDRKLFVYNWLVISSYPYETWPIGILSQFEHIILIMWLILWGVRFRLSMIDSKDDVAVTYVNSKTGFGSLRIIQYVDHLIYISNTNMEEVY